MRCQAPRFPAASNGAARQSDITTHPPIDQSKRVQISNAFL
jgi:hypothetical protein